MWSISRREGEPGRSLLIPVIVAGIVVFVDVLRVYLPSLITILGQAGGTPAEYLGGYAMACFLLGFAAIGLARLVPPARLAVIAGVVLCAARLGLQFTHGGPPQLYLATAGLLAGLVWLVAIAMSVGRPRPAAISVMAGLAVAATAHAALSGVDLVWRTGTPAWLLLIAELCWFAVSAWRSPREGDGDVASARWWWSLGPVLLLWGIYAGNFAYAGAAHGWPAWAASLVVTVTAVLAVAVTARPSLLGPYRGIPAAMLVVSAIGFAYAPTTAEGIAGVSAGWSVTNGVLAQLGIAGCLGWLASSTRVATRARRGLAVAAGMQGFVIGVFGFYAAYDLYLPNRWIPFAAALVVAIPALMTTTGPVEPVPRLGIRFGAVVVVAALATTFVPPAHSTALSTSPPTDGLRVAGYNVRMGFGQAGTMTVAEQAAALAELDAHVIALSEVDRGWFLNGGRDDLRLIADRLGMRFIWAPAADELWGDAVLTNLPVTEVRQHVLVDGGPTGAQALQVRVRRGDTEVRVIATHLQPPPDWAELDQAEQLADIASDAGGDGTPVVLVGDLNTAPGEAPFEVLLAAGLIDPFAAVRPFPTMAGDATTQIDHILVSKHFRGVDPANPDIEHSDHRPIAVTLLPRD